MKITLFFKKYFDVFETIILLGFAVGMFLIIQEIEYSFWVVRIFLGLLAILYWIKAIDREKDYSKEDKISEKMIWYSLIIAPIAMLSKIQFSEKADTFLIFSIIALVFALFFRIFKAYKIKFKIKAGDITRIIVAIILNFAFYSLPLTPLT